VYVESLRDLKMPSGVYKRRPEMFKSPSAETRAKISESVRAKAQANARDPEWRKKVSESTKKRMHDPEIRQRHLDGLKRAHAKSPNGNNFNGGFGAPPNELEESYNWLCSLGYQRNIFIRANGIRYQMDYALHETKICIEIDGTSHRPKYRQEHDKKKDADLKTIGWTVVRVRHW
jgi:hypothetical protein